jgi:hypothetical protein
MENHRTTAGNGVSNRYRVDGLAALDQKVILKLLVKAGTTSGRIDFLQTDFRGNRALLPITPLSDALIIDPRTATNQVGHINSEKGCVRK